MSSREGAAEGRVQGGNSAAPERPAEAKRRRLIPFKIGSDFVKQMHQNMISDERPVVLHQGTYKKTATIGEAVFMITGMTIGAGILGLPYAVSQVGLLPGVFLIIFLGLIMLSLNLMIGRVAVAAGGNLQLPGLAGKYLGGRAKAALSIAVILSSYGVLLAYVVGEGVSLSALFGGSPIGWSVIFWSVGSFLIWLGLQRIRHLEKIFSLAVMGIILGLALGLLQDFHLATLTVVHWPAVFMPVGVILFALSATPAIAEARALLPGRIKDFRRALFIGTLVPVIIYILFVIAVVGLGVAPTAVATVGIGSQFGSVILILANVFAVLAMCTGFMGLGTALKETFMWDYKVPAGAAQFLVISVPLALFLLGSRHFVNILNIVGGLFIAVEAIIMILTYQKAINTEAGAVGWGRRSNWLLILPLLLFFSILAVFSLYGALMK
ncbi:MAG: hypothetical protein HY983_02630 [Candidatus Magasanikbacteria bacterium]|nr:hypothetical protein [Candidatus Magasanikbacteria bacterium]